MAHSFPSWFKSVNQPEMGIKNHNYFKELLLQLHGFYIKLIYKNYVVVAVAFLTKNK